MAQRTATVTQFRYSKKRSRGDDKWRDVANLPDGADFLSLVYGVWNGLTRETLQDRGKQRYCEPASYIAQGRSLTLSALAGTYGDAGSVREVSTGVERLAHAGDLTNAVSLRLALFVPIRGTSALMFVEHVPGIAFGSRFIEHLELCWTERYPDWTLRKVTLTRPDAWIANAELELVQAEVYDHKVSLEDQGVPASMGTIKTIWEPKKGQRFFSREVRSSVLGGKVPRGELLGMTEEPDQVKVRLGDGEQSKTFVIGKDKTPAVRMLMTDYNEPALGDDRFRSWCGAEVADLFRTVGSDWNAASLDGEWDEDLLKQKVTLTHGR